MTQGSKESALSRWSQRKLKVQEASEQPILEAESKIDAPAEVPAQEAPALTDADMPDIELLSEDSDYSGFMSSGVSDNLRNLALRKLFQSSVFNIRDGLDEYDEDYTTFEKLGDIVTSDMKHELEMKEKKLREAQAEENAEESEDAPDDASETQAIDDDGEQDPPETISETDSERKQEANEQ